MLAPASLALALALASAAAAGSAQPPPSAEPLWRAYPIEGTGGGGRGRPAAPSLRREQPPPAGTAQGPRERPAEPPRRAVPPAPPAVRAADPALREVESLLRALIVAGWGLAAFVLFLRALAAHRRVHPRTARAVPHYVSADTVPDEFAVARRFVVAPAFLVLYALLSAAIVPALPALMEWYGRIVAWLAHVPRWEVLGKGGSLSFRPFLLLLIVLLSVFAVGPASQRLKMLAFSGALYASAVFLVDALLARAQSPLVPPFSQVGGIVTGLLGLLVIIVAVFAHYRLPAGIRVETRSHDRRGLRMLAVAVVVSLVLVVAFSVARNRYFEDFHVRFVGGLDSELVVFLLGVFVVLAVGSALNRARKPTDGPHLSVAFLIPAYNEAGEIGNCLRSLNAAAAQYGDRCAVYVVDNGSRDGTRAVAEETLAACAWLDGHVLECPERGKSRALNYGLARLDAEIVARIDADTIVEPSALETLVPWFWDESVGGVGGLPLPNAGTPRWLYPLRLIEVYYGVAFLRVAQSAADAAMVMPGLIASYRRSVLEELDGFGEGFNGEDADITMRIGRLGYRIVTDPQVRVYTEVPKTLAHLREQRQRWARGLFHMAGRNMSSIWMLQGPRGLWNLPWSIFNASRRSLMIPILASVGAVELRAPDVYSLREVSVVAGFLVGLQLIVITVLLVVHGRFRIVPFVPTYLLFRLLRSYIAFEAVLTLRLKTSTSTRGSGRERTGSGAGGPVERGSLLPDVALDARPRSPTATV